MMRGAAAVVLLVGLAACGGGLKHTATEILLGRAHVSVVAVAGKVDVVSIEIEVAGSGKPLLIAQVRDGDDGLQPVVDGGGQAAAFAALGNALTNGVETGLTVRVTVAAPSDAPTTDMTFFVPDVSLLGTDYIGFTVTGFQVDVQSAVMLPSNDDVDAEVQILLLGRFGP